MRPSAEDDTGTTELLSHVRGSDHFFPFSGRCCIWLVQLLQWCGFRTLLQLIDRNSSLECAGRIIKEGINAREIPLAGGQVNLARLLAGSCRQEHGVQLLLIDPGVRTVALQPPGMARTEVAVEVDATQVR